jgi:hypothetical protein
VVEVLALNIVKGDKFSEMAPFCFPFCFRNWRAKFLSLTSSLVIQLKFDMAITMLFM